MLIGNLANQENNENCIGIYGIGVRNKKSQIFIKSSAKKERLKWNLESSNSGVIDMELILKSAIFRKLFKKQTINAKVKNSWTMFALTCCMKFNNRYAKRTNIVLEICELGMLANLLEYILDQLEQRQHFF